MADDRPRDDSKGDGEPPPYTPYLKVRYEIGDLYQRRTTLPPGTVFWACPDIAASPTDPSGNVMAGVPTTVSVTVFNWGLSVASPTAVNFYWANPALAISPGNVTQINSAPVLVTVPAQNAVTVTCPDLWVPQFVNGGHECLIVQAGCPTDPVITPLQPVTDRHVGQRNLTVAAPDMKMQLQLRADNPFDESLTFRLHHTAVALRGDFSGYDRAAVLGLVTAADPSHFEPTMKSTDVSDEVALRLVDRQVVRDWRKGAELEEKRRAGDDGDRGMSNEFSQTPSARLRPLDHIRSRLQRAPDYGPKERGFAVAEFELGPQESALLTLRGRPAADTNTSVLHHVTQVVDGCEVGGFSFFEPSTALAKRWQREAGER
jgi:hypothetical protein